MQFWSVLSYSCEPSSPSAEISATGASQLVIDSIKIIVVLC
jgi:hypothetical protein